MKRSEKDLITYEEVCHWYEKEFYQDDLVVNDDDIF